MEEREKFQFDSLCEKIIGTTEVFMYNMSQNRDKGNKAAGLRARKTSLELEKLLKEYRKLSVKA